MRAARLEAAEKGAGRKLDPASERGGSAGISFVIGRLVAGQTRSEERKVAVRS
jgi:hypothetical protein